MHIKEDLYAIDKTLIAEASQRISRWTLRKISRKARNIRYVKIKNTWLSKDIEEAFKDEKYKTILSPENISKKTCKVIQNIFIPEKIAAELKHMKQIFPHTFHHILMVTILGTKISMDKNLDYDYMPRKMARSCIVHDIGKSRMPPEVLNKVSPLTRNERALLRDHPLLGYLLLHYYYGKNHDKCDFASYEHHERLDGSGYPRGLKRINKYSQPIAVADVFDALISKRPYRKTPYTLRAALDFLLEEARKKKVNKKVAYLLVCYARKDKPPLQRLKVSKKWRDKPPLGNVWGKTAKK